MALLLVVLFAAVVWIGVDALHARADLKAAAGQVRILQSQVAKGDKKAAAGTLTSLQRHAASARASIADLYYRDGYAPQSPRQAAAAEHVRSAS